MDPCQRAGAGRPLAQAAPLVAGERTARERLDAPRFCAARPAAAIAVSRSIGPRRYESIATWTVAIPVSSDHRFVIAAKARPSDALAWPEPGASIRFSNTASFTLVGANGIF